MNIGLNWLPETAYIYMMIFARVGTMLMLMPAFGESLIPSRNRLGFALMFSLVLYPLVSQYLPELGNMNIFAVSSLLIQEVIIGLILGSLGRFIVSSTQTAGTVIAFQLGLSMAQTADPTQNGMQGALIGNFLSLVGIMLIFATDLHHLILAAIYDSYEVFIPGGLLMFGDAADLALRMVAAAFVIGVQMAAPFIVFGLVFYLGLGILARLMPQVQVFFVAMPANIGLGLILFAFLLTAIMGWYLLHVEAQITMLRGG
jgi:flagellar biosynthetic protein FliR